MKWLMSSRRGRRMVWMFLRKCGIYRTTFSGEYPNTSAFREGWRAAGLYWVLQMQASCPGSYIQMIKEHEGGRSDSDSGSGNNE